MRGHRGQRGCPRRCAAGAIPALLSPSAGRGAGAGPNGVRALPCETEFRTGKVKAGFCGPCFSKRLEESRIGNGVWISSHNCSSGRESALIFPKSDQARPPSELSSEGCQNAVFGPYFKGKRGERVPVANSVRYGEDGEGKPPSKLSFEGCRETAWSRNATGSKPEAPGGAERYSPTWKKSGTRWNASLPVGWGNSQIDQRALVRGGHQSPLSDTQIFGNHSVTKYARAVQSSGCIRPDLAQSNQIKPVKEMPNGECRMRKGSQG